MNLARYFFRSSVVISPPFVAIEEAIFSATSPSYSACGNADVLVVLDDQNERTTHEFRIASNEMSELPFSYTAGVFIDERILMTINEYNYNRAASPEGGSASSW